MTQALHLPPDLIWYTLTHLPFSDLKQARLVCKLFKEVIDDPRNHFGASPFWSTRCTWGISGHPCELFGKTSWVGELGAPDWRAADLFAIMMRVRAIKNPDLREVVFYDRAPKTALVEIFRQFAPKLTLVYNLPLCHVEQLGYHFPDLEGLSIMEAHMNTLNLCAFRKLKSLEVHEHAGSQFSPITVLQKCPSRSSLETLVYRGWKQDWDFSNLCTLIDLLPKLRRLTLEVWFQDSGQDIFYYCRLHDTWDDCATRLSKKYAHLTVSIEHSPRQGAMPAV